MDEKIKRRRWWLAKVHRTKGGQVPEDVMHREQATADRRVSCPAGCASRMSASVTWNSQASTQTAGLNYLQTTAVGGALLLEKGSRRVTKSATTKQEAVTAISRRRSKFVCNSCGNWDRHAKIDCWATSRCYQYLSKHMVAYYWTTSHQHEREAHRFILPLYRN